MAVEVAMETPVAPAKAVSPGKPVVLEILVATVELEGAMLFAGYVIIPLSAIEPSAVGNPKSAIVISGITGFWDRVKTCDVFLVTGREPIDEFSKILVALR